MSFSDQHLIQYLFGKYFCWAQMRVKNANLLARYGKFRPIIENTLLIDLLPELYLTFITYSRILYSHFQITKMLNLLVNRQSVLGNSYWKRYAPIQINLQQYIRRHMNSFLERLESHGNCKDMLRQSCKKNGLNTSLAGQMSISKLRLLSQKFEKAYSALKDKIKTSWIENELRAFNWILIALSALENALISEFSQNHWIILQNIFQYKTRNFLKFETRRFLSEKKAKNKNWSEQQNSLLLKIVMEMERSPQGKVDKQLLSSQQGIPFEGMSEQKSGQNNEAGRDKIHWNEVARRLFEQSNEKYFRSSKHCRERWYNHIDPSKQRGKWKQSEDQTLLELVNKLGKKWSEIALLLHRTEHNVKNRYHSLQSKGKKDLKMKKNSKMISIEQNMVKQEIKEQNEKDPVITTYDISQKFQKKDSRQVLKIAQQLNVNGQNIHQFIITQDASISKNQNYLFSPFFQPYSPRTLTPFLGSNSPSPFPFSMINIPSFLSEQNKFTEAINATNQSFTSKNYAFQHKQ